MFSLPIPRDGLTALWIVYKVGLEWTFLSSVASDIALVVRQPFEFPLTNASRKASNSRLFFSFYCPNNGQLFTIVLSHGFTKPGRTRKAFIYPHSVLGSKVTYIQVTKLILKILHVEVFLLLQRRLLESVGKTLHMQQTTTT